MRDINVMVADGNKNNAESLKDFLSVNNNIGEITIAKDGKEAVELFKSKNVDVIICDLFLPVLDGFEVIKKINNMNMKEKPCIILTSVVVGDYISKKVINTEGIDLFVIKPINYTLLYKKIVNVILNNKKDIKNDNVDFLMSSNNLDTKSSNFKKISSSNYILEAQIIRVLHKLRVPANLRGYRYIQDAVKMVLYNMDILNKITKELYPSIAEKNNTTAIRVERAIRHAITVTGEKGNVEYMKEMFNLSINEEKVKPKNSEFIAKISERVRLGTT